MKTVDAVVVGSGFGGAVAACRLSERGRFVVVLERGRRWGRQDFPRVGQGGAPWWFREGEAGLFERRRFPGMTVVVAAGVGGGSLIYTNVQRIPPAAALEGWPAPISVDYLRPYYERVQEMLEPAPLPRDLQRLRAFEAAHAALGRRVGLERPPLAVRFGQGDDERVNRFGASQQPCNLCGQCVFGCDRHSKNTLDLTYLKRAETLGADLRPLSEVNRIAPRPSGYEVSFRRVGIPGSEEVLRTRSVYLAAGSLGTTELLLRCRDVEKTLPRLSRRLGLGWSANGDFFAGLVGSRTPIVPTVGPSVAGGYEASEGFYTLEGAIPAGLVGRRRTPLRVLNLLLALRRLVSRSRATLALPDAPAESCGDADAEALLRHLGAFFLMGRDASNGRLRLDARGALDLDWDPRSSAALLDRMRRYLAELGRAYGGWMVVPERWWLGQMGTVHPLGGCAMGRDASQGVCDPCGRVFGCENLFVCDGSLFPGALGFPPSMTIAALAEHIVEKSLG